MTCNCIQELNIMLADRNTKISPTIIFGNPSRVTVTIETEVIERKRGARPMAMLPEFCPFCGVRYEDQALALSQSIVSNEGGE